MSVNPSAANPSVCPNCGLPLQGMESHCPRCGRTLSIAPPAPPPPLNAAPPAPPVAVNCRNCGFQLAQFQPICPNCGASIVSAQSAPWPPPPAGYGAPAPPSTKLFTGNAAADTVIGFIMVFVSLALYGIGLIAMPVLYLSIRQSYRYLARGIGYGIATVGVLVLGLFVWCVGGIALMNR